MLTWVGKRPVTHVQAFPAQHIETFDPTGQLDEPRDDQWADWPDKYPPGGLLFHGDNQEVLGHLLAHGFRGKVNLIYIDPPFDSGADYVRRVSLRGPAGKAKIEGEGYSLGEQLQYTDIWTNDEYLQFMYERLALMRELLAENGVLYLHADPKRSHQLRLILDEIFGPESFRNEVVWWYWNKMQGNVQRFASNHDTIIVYSPGSPTFHRIREERPDIVRQLKRVWDPATGSLVNAKDDEGNLIYLESSEKTVDDVWRISMLQPADESENLRFPTQKPEDLLSMIVASSTNPGDLVLDCFVGSGTTSAVAQKLGRRWIACDINKGAIQTTAKRVQDVIENQVAKGGQQSLERDSHDPAQHSFTTWRVNDYDLTIHQEEVAQLVIEHLGIQRTKSDPFFDGTLGRTLVKLVPFNHPLSPVDLEDLRRELDARQDEERPVTVVCLGIELAAQKWIDDWNARPGRKHVNRIHVVELRSDERYGGLIRHEPAEARVSITRDRDTATVRIDDFISPTILQRLAQQDGVVRPTVDDWRQVVDCVMIDPSYDGEVFNVYLSDVPAKKREFVEGSYEIPLTDKPTTVAVKIIDMLGEEVLITQDV